MRSSRLCTLGGSDPTKKIRADRGAALLMVIFLIVLTTALLTSLTDSTYVAMRLNGATERRVKAEYLLKSAVNLAQVLIKFDTTPHDEPKEDIWMKFSEGLEVPGEALGITEPNTRVTLLIQSTSGKLPIQALITSGVGKSDWIERFARLFKLLGFDDDKDEVDKAGLVPGKHFSADELAANLVDYMDADTESYNVNSYRGIESDLPPGTFRNSPNVESLENELPAIPGFTPNRVQRLLPYIAKYGSGRVNINAAPDKVLQALSADITEAEAQQIVSFRTSGDGPFTGDNKPEVLDRLVSAPVAASLGSITDVKGSYFDVIVKVSYGNFWYMASATLKTEKDLAKLPSIQSFVVY